MSDSFCAGTVDWQTLLMSHEFCVVPLKVPCDAHQQTARQFPSRARRAKEAPVTYAKTLSVIQAPNTALAARYAVGRGGAARAAAVNLPRARR